MRLAAYAGTSVALAAGIVLKALHSRPNFYSVCVYFAESNAALMILFNLVLLSLGSLLVGLQRLLYGPLRPIETEQLYEKAWFAVTETCLAMTIFREDLGVWFVVMFIALLGAKVWGWIGEGRLEILEQQPPENPGLFHTRLSASLFLSMLFNVWLLNYSVETVRQTNRANMMIMFAFEFALLNISSLSNLVRYGITIQETLIVREQTNVAMQARRKELEQQRRAAKETAIAAGEEPPEEVPIEELLDQADVDVPGWEEKSRWIFYLDLTTDFLRLLLYVTFFCVLCKLYSMPIHIIRDVALAVRSFYRRVTDFIKYRHATRDMHSRYPDATVEEISTQDVCIICREGMTARSETATEAQAENNASSRLDERLRPKKLPCGHILHFSCLRSWLERQQNCPTCRQPVLSSPTPRQSRDGPDAPANNNAAGAPQAQPNRDQAPAANVNQPTARMNRMRTFNLGPLRLTVGTGRIIQAPGANANLPAPTVAIANGTGSNHTTATNPTTQANGMIPPSMAPESNSAIIHSSINHLERMLVQDLARLRLQTEQLNVLRVMQSELARLRIAQGMQQQNTEPGAATGSTIPSFQTGSISPVPVSAFRGDHTSEPIRSGSANLPAGVTIPEGWTLLPLQRLPEQATFASTTIPVPMTQPLQRSRSMDPSPQHASDMHTAAPSDIPSLIQDSSPSAPSHPREAEILSNTSAQTGAAPTGTLQSSDSIRDEPNTSQSSIPGNAESSQTPSTQAEAPTRSTKTDEPPKPSGWQWPTTSTTDSPSSEAGRDHTATVEDELEGE